MGQVIAEIVERLGADNDFNHGYVLMRRFADNDLLIIGPFDKFKDAAEAMTPLDTIKPMFKEEDLANLR